VKAQLEDVHGEVVQLQQANARLGADLAGRTAELEQLKTLSIAGHTTLQEYTGKLKVWEGTGGGGGRTGAVTDDGSVSRCNRAVGSILLNCVSCFVMKAQHRSWR
jgi:hypothetical protein